MQQPMPARSAGIDLLRGLAVLLVVLHHTQLRLHVESSPLGALLPGWAVRILFWSGYYSVIAFFVISGFLITTLSLRRWGELARIDVARFYRLRAARILPLLLTLLLVVSLLHLAGVEGYVIRPERASLARALLAALSFHVNYLEGHHGYLPPNWDVLWSLSIEEAFYLIFPIVCLGIRSRALLAALLLALMVAGPVSRSLLVGMPPWDDYAWLSGMDGIALGCAAALLARDWHPARGAVLAIALAGATATLLVVGFRGTSAALGLATTGLNVTVLEVGIALLLVAVQAGALPLRADGWSRLLQVLGRCSYEVYLTHMFVVLTLVRLAKWASLPAALIPLWDAVAVGAAGLLGWTVARYYSEPLNRALRRDAAR